MIFQPINKKTINLRVHIEYQAIILMAFKIL